MTEEVRRMKKHAEERTRKTAPESVILRAFPGGAFRAAVAAGGIFLSPLVILAHMLPYALPVFPEAGRLVLNRFFLGLFLPGTGGFLLVELGNLRTGRKGVVAFLFRGKGRNLRPVLRCGSFLARRGGRSLRAGGRYAFRHRFRRRNLSLFRQRKMEYAGTARAGHFIFFAGADGGIGHIATETAGRTFYNHGNLTASSLSSL